MKYKLNSFFKDEVEHFLISEERDNGEILAVYSSDNRPATHTMYRKLQGGTGFRGWTPNFFTLDVRPYITGE